MDCHLLHSPAPSPLHSQHLQIQNPSEEWRENSRRKKPNRTNPTTIKPRRAAGARGAKNKTAAQVQAEPALPIWYTTLHDHCLYSKAWSGASRVSPPMCAGERRCQTHSFMLSEPARENSPCPAVPFTLCTSPLPPHLMLGTATPNASRVSSALPRHPTFMVGAQGNHKQSCAHAGI